MCFHRVGSSVPAITLGPHDVVQEVFYRSADPAQRGCGLRQWAGQEHGVVCTLDFEQVRGNEPAIALSQSLSAVPPTRRLGAEASCSAVTVGMSVSNGVSQIAAISLAVTAGAASEARDFPMTTGTAPVEVTTSSMASSTRALTQARCSAVDVNSGTTQLSSRVMPSRRRTASRAYINSGASAVYRIPGIMIAARAGS